MITKTARRYLDLIYDLCSEKITIEEFKKEVKEMGDKQLSFNFDKKEEK